MSYAKFKLGESRQRKKQPTSKKVQQMSMSLLHEMDRKFEGTNHYSVGHQHSQTLIPTKTQPSEESSYSQLMKQQRKLNDIQNSYYKFQSKHQSSLSSNKENHDINLIITGLEDRFIYKPSRIVKRNDPDQIQELKEIIHQLQQRDGSQRLDIANLKKQNAEIRTQIGEFQKQIHDLEKIQKRDNDYILKIDKTITQLKEKLQEAQKQKQIEINKNVQLTQSLNELKEENNYLQSLIQQYQQSIFKENDQGMPKFNQQEDDLVDQLWQTNHQKQLTPINISLINNCSGNFETQTPTVKVSQLLHNSSCAKNNSLLNQSEEIGDADEALKQFLGSLDEEQAQQIYSILSQIVEEEQRKGNSSLNNSIIYEKLVHKILSDDNHQQQQQQILTRNNSKEFNTFKCGSSMSNFSFAVNSDRKKLKLPNQIKSQDSIDSDIYSQMANISKSLETEQIEQQKQRSLINYVQTNLNSSSTQDNNEQDNTNRKNSIKKI